MIRILFISLFIHLLTFSIFNVKVSSLDSKFSDFYFWGDLFSSEEVCILNHKDIKRVPLELFVEFEGVRILPKNLYIFWENKKIKKSYEKPLYVKKLERTSNVINIQLSQKFIKSPFLKSMVFLLFISKEGYVKMVSKLSSSGNIFIDKLIENILRKKIFDCRDKDYYKKIRVEI